MSKIIVGYRESYGRAVDRWHEEARQRAAEEAARYTGATQASAELYRYLFRGAYRAPGNFRTGWEYAFGKEPK